MTLSLVRATPTTDVGDRVTGDGMWSLTHELVDDDDTGMDRVVVVATHLPTGLQLTHDLADVDAWLMTGLALGELKVQAVATYNGIATAEDKDAARAALVKLDLLLPAGAADAVEYHCECSGGLLAMGPGRRLVHVDACRGDLDGGPCDPDEHRICLEPSARLCEHGTCKARACAYAPPCAAGHHHCCGTCCNGDQFSRD